jgi:hypothetical protein
MKDRTLVFFVRNESVRNNKVRYLFLFLAGCDRASLLRLSVLLRPLDLFRKGVVAFFISKIHGVGSLVHAVWYHSLFSFPELKYLAVWYEIICHVNLEKTVGLLVLAVWYRMVSFLE